MKLQTQQRILREDIPDAPSWVDKIIYPINRFIENVSQILTSQVVFAENIRGQFHSNIFTTTSTYNGTQANFTAITFTNTLGVKATGCLLLQIYVNDGNFNAIGTPWNFSWFDVNGLITVSLITGLTASTSYYVNFLIF